MFKPSTITGLMHSSTLKHLVENMEKKDWHIVPECYIDTNLVEFLLNSKGVNHQKGCNLVAKQMKETNLKDIFSVGVIDNDKRQHSYVKEFEIVASTSHIELMKHKTRPHYLFRISPAMDQFILDCASEVSVNLQEYGLPDDIKSFTQITKDVKAKQDIRFKNLFRAILPAKEMSIFHSVINYLNTHKYQCEEETIKNFFSVT